MNDDLATTSAPSTYEEAESLMRSLGAHELRATWANLSVDQAEALLRSLAPPPEAPHAIPFDRSVGPSTPTVRIDAGAEQDSHEAQNSPRPAPHLAEKTLLAVLETAPDGIVVVDNHGSIVLVNGQIETMFGYDRAELLGRKIELLVPVRHRDRHVQQRRDFFKAPHLRAMGSGLPLFGLRKNGQEFPVEISLSPLDPEEGPLVTAVIRDVTERKLHEQSLAKAELRYRSLVEEIPAVTFMAALDEGINELYVSPQIVDLLGFTQQEWLDDPVLWHRQLHPEDRERWHAEFARTCATAQPFRSVYRFLARDGRVVWVLGEAKVIRDKAGRPMFLQGVAFDITRMKYAEEELKLLNRTLEDRVVDRTAALKRSNDALARYGGHVAHELKRPVRSIFEVLHPTSRSKAKDPPRKRLEDIQKIADDMAKLVDEMLAYARVSEEAKQFSPVDGVALFEAARAELAKDIEACGATVTFRTKLAPIVSGHRESLKLVFRNLIDNAIKYRSKRRLQVRVTAKPHEDGWHFEVRDNGMGIKKFIKYTNDNNWELIFGLFRRDHVKGPHGNVIPGHGIGLSYCQRVIEHHGGKIWVESEFGKGSTFHFTLPADRRERGEDER
jgi:PAS domain S-box-containing protein